MGIGIPGFTRVAAKHSLRIQHNEKCETKLFNEKNYFNSLHESAETLKTAPCQDALRVAPFGL